VTTKPRAELIADGGEAATSDDLFRSRAFYDAEGVTHTLRLETDDGEARVPLLVREIPGGEGLDATSPYGYPGAVVETNGPPAAPADVDWSESGLVSIFARERLEGEPWLAGARERSAVLLHDPARPRRVRPRLAEQIRSNERRGWTVERVRGSDASPEQRAAFERAYEETMRRADATERYFFSSDYFASVLSFADSWLLLATAAGGGFGAGAIVGRSDAMLHYFLGGTAEDQLPESPFKNVVEAMMRLADELGLRLNLGGGVRSGDGLEAFKRGFANAELPFRTHEIVSDEAEYARLSAGRPRSGFFPAYRAD
jgi:GNAT acetyltransferase-like protein